LASKEGHTETLALLLANKADVHAANQVIIIILLLEFYFIMEIGWIFLCNMGFKRRTHRDARAASGQQGRRASG
jgi:hypothetical protein